MKARHKAGLRRGAKFAAFSVIGALLANGAALVTYALTRTNLSPDTIAIIALVAGSALAGVAKTIQWQEMGVDEPTPNVPSLTSDKP